MDKKEYKIQEHTVYQTELTIGQDIELLQIVDQVKVEFGKIDFKKNGIQGLIQFLLKTGLIEKVIKIILQGDVDKIDIKKITNSELEAIVTDFLEFNAGFVEKLRTWSKSLMMVAQETAK